MQELQCCDQPQALLSCRHIGHVQDSTRLEALLTWMEEEPVQGSIFFVVHFTLT